MGVSIEPAKECLPVFIRLYARISDDFKHDMLLGSLTLVPRIINFPWNG